MLFRGQLLLGVYRGEGRILQRISVEYGPGYDWTFKAGAKQHLGQSKYLASAENGVLNVECPLQLEDQDTLH